VARSASATGEANAAIAASASACLDRGLVLVVMGTRIHAAPPLKVDDSDVATGPAILGEALVEADTFPA
jgi:4-aminobutyrate aminotransferase-like enzyme